MSFRVPLQERMEQVFEIEGPSLYALGVIESSGILPGRPFNGEGHLVRGQLHSTHFSTESVSCFHIFHPASKLNYPHVGPREKVIAPAAPEHLPVSQQNHFIVGSLKLEQVMR